MGILLIYILEFFILTYMCLKALGCLEDYALASNEGLTYPYESR